MGGDSRAAAVEGGRERIAQVFRYLRDLNLHRNPAKRLIQDQLWRLPLSQLPDHPSIQRVAVDTGREGGDEDGTPSPYLLKVDRLAVTKPPTLLTASPTGLRAVGTTRSLN